MNIFSHYRAAAWLLPLDLRQLRAVLARMGSAFPSITAVELFLLNDTAIAAINAEQLGARGVTNILSFPAAFGMIGSLFLSLDTYQRECLLYGQEAEIHLLRLLAHGLAHLSGLDHSAEMTNAEDKCLAIGLDCLEKSKKI